MVGAWPWRYRLLLSYWAFLASYLLELFRNRWTAQSAQEARDAGRQHAGHLDRVAYERNGLRAVHAAIHDLLNGVNAIAVAQGKAEPAGLDWREGDNGQELRAAAVNASVRCSLESALLLHPPVIDAVDHLTGVAHPMYMTRESGMDLRHNTDFYGAVTAASRAIAARLRELYGFAASEG
jgi:hypothetical protein